MKTKELINKLLDCPMDKKISVAVQNGDGTFKYYKVECFNPKTGDIIVPWKAVKESISPSRAKEPFPNDSCVKCYTEEEYKAVVKRLSDNLKEWELDVGVAIMSLVDDWLPIYVHVVDGKLEEFKSENQSKVCYDAEDYILICDAKKGE